MPRGGVERRPGDGNNRPVLVPRKVALAAGREPTFYIGGGNGVALVEKPLLELGWKRSTDKHNENFKIKWVECKNTINYNSFKEGDQMVNHIPNCQLLTNKMGLLTSLQSYDRLSTSLRRRDVRIRLGDFIPETYRIDDAKERELFLEAFKEGTIWISKPTGMNQGKGIYLVRDLDEFKQTLQERDERQQARRSHRPNMGRIIQRYIRSPLLLCGRKFDIRSYMLIADTVPYLVLYHKGYVRLSLVDYDIAATDLTAHLTNQYIQKKDPTYQEAKEGTVWSMDRFNDYINQTVADDKGIEQDWVYKGLATKMKQIMLFCFHAVKNRLHCKVGYFDLYGLDFMIDGDMKVWLIEVNVNPSLATNCEALREVIPGVVTETLGLSIECFEKSRRGQPLVPLQSLQNFEILYNGCTKSQSRATTAGPGVGADCAPAGPQPPTRPRSQSPTRTTRSPAKDRTQGHPKVASRVAGPVEVAASGKGVVSRGMTPRATPASSPPALRGAVPAAGARPEVEAVSAAITAADRITLKMTHNSASPPASGCDESPPDGDTNQPQPPLAPPANVDATMTLDTDAKRPVADATVTGKALLPESQTVRLSGSDSHEMKLLKTKPDTKRKEISLPDRRSNSRTKTPVPKPRTLLKAAKSRTVAGRGSVGPVRGN